jgi:charged multivesicular body protein 6
MGNWLSRKKSKLSEQDNAIYGLKKQRDNIKQYQEKLLLCLEKEKDLAKQLLREGRKDRAKLLLKKKRFQESQLEKSEQQLDNLEKLTQDLEFAQIQVQVLDGLKTGNAALEKIHDVLSVEDIEKILEETKEGVDKQNEIDALLSNNLSPEDLEAVETELEKIMAEEHIAREELSPDDLSLPEVPDDPIAQERARLRQNERILVKAS